MLKALVRPLALLAATALGGWAAVRVQFGFTAAPVQLDEEFLIFGISVAASLVLVPLVFLPVSFLVERFVPSRFSKAAVVVVSVVAAVLLGLWVYIGFLHRPLVFVMQRDIASVLCFSLLGLGYGLARVAITHLTPPSSGQPSAAANVERSASQ